MRPARGVFRGQIMRDFLNKNKKLIPPAVLLLIFTILLCIPTTLQFLVKVFGFVAYVYLVTGYVLFVFACKKFKPNVKKSRLALYVSFLVLFLMTLHVGICGRETVEKSVGEYIGYAWNNPKTVGGSLYTVLSLPIVLLLKYTGSVIVYCLATVGCGAAIVFPLAFEPTGKGKKQRNTAHKQTEITSETKPVTVTERSTSGTTPTVPPTSVAPAYTPSVPPVLPRVTPTVAPTVAATTAPATTNTTEVVYDENSPEYARQILFGDAHPKRRPVATQQPPVTPPEPKPTVFPRQTAPTTPPTNQGVHEEKGSYRIIEGVNAHFVQPDVTPYTNNYLNQREEARNRLFNNYTITDDYESRSERLSGETMGDALRQDQRTNPYIPSETLYETQETPQPEPEPEVSEPPVIPTQPAPVETAPVPTPAPTPSSDVALDENGEIIDVLPTIKDSPFVAAIRAESGNGGPVNVHPTTPTQPTPVQTVRKPAPTPVVPVVEPEPEPEQEPEDPSHIRQYRLTKPYAAPPVSILKDHVKEDFSPYVENYAELKEIFEVKLKNYGIDVTLIDVIKGPTVTLCVLDLDEKCSIKKVTAADKDIERLLKTPQGQSINILSKLPNSSYFGIEVPNPVKGIVAFKEVMASPEWNNARGDLLLGLGKTNSGKIVVEDLAAMPHALVAGSSGSGKSVCINAIIASLLYRYSPDEMKLVLIDLKFVEMANFAGLPHMLFKNPLNEVPEVINALNWLREETSRRFMAFRDILCRNLGEYNAKVPPEKQLPRIVMIIDEASELMTHPTGRKVMEATLSSIARVARAAGVHMLFATQTPSKDVITSEIQNNMTTKIAFAVSDYVQSQVIFKSPEAAKLLGKGDMMIKNNFGMTRAQCALVTTDEIDQIVDYVKKNNPTEFDEEAIDRILHGSKEEVPATAPVETTSTKPSNLLERKNFDDDAGFQDLVRESLRIFVNTGKVSATYIQRRFSKGYNTIANVMDYLESKGYVSEPVNNKRTLLITKEKFYELYPDCVPEDEEN